LLSWVHLGQFIVSLRFSACVFAFSCEEDLSLDIWLCSGGCCPTPAQAAAAQVTESQKKSCVTRSTTQGWRKFSACSWEAWRLHSAS